MSVPVLEAIADAIMAMEGWRADTRSYRNRNPGNLRVSGTDQAFDAAGYRVFPSLLDGYAALVSDLQHKVTGHTRTAITSKSTLLDLFRVYAPAGDGNAPMMYAAFVATWLRAVYKRAEITSLTTLAEVFELAGQEVPHGVTVT